MVDAVKQLEAGRPAKDMARKLGTSDQTLFHWGAKYSGLEVHEARRMRMDRRGEPALEGASRHWESAATVTP
jgi:hypothetical protein